MFLFLYSKDEKKQKKYHSIKEIYCMLRTGAYDSRKDWSGYNALSFTFRMTSATRRVLVG